MPNSLLGCTYTSVWIQILSSFLDEKQNAFHVHRTLHVLARDDIIHHVTIWNGIINNFASSPSNILKLKGEHLSYANILAPSLSWVTNNGRMKRKHFSIHHISGQRDLSFKCVIRSILVTHTNVFEVNALIEVLMRACRSRNSFFSRPLLASFLMFTTSTGNYHDFFYPYRMCFYN